MPALQPRDVLPRNAAAGALDLCQQPRVRVLVAGKSGGHRFGLRVVLVPVGLLESDDGRQDEAGTPASSEPRENTGAGGRTEPGGFDSRRAKLVGPQLSVLALGGGEAPVDFSEFRIVLGGGDGVVERRAVLLASPVLEVPLDGTRFHGSMLFE